MLACSSKNNHMCFACDWFRDCHVTQFMAMEWEERFSGVSINHLSDSSGKVLESGSCFSKTVVCGYENYKCEDKGWFSQFSSIAQSCPTLCDPVNHSTPGLPVHHQLPEFTQTHVHEWCHPAISSSVIPFSSSPQSFLASESFPMSQVFAWSGQSTGVSALASFLPKKSQG